MSDAKAVRKQIKNIVQDQVKDILTEELVAALEKRLMGVVIERLNKIDERQKDIQLAMMRASAPKG